MDKNNRILQVIDQLNIGGAEQICITLTNLLNASQYKVNLLLLADDGLLTSQLDEHISIIRLKRKRLFDIDAMLKCAQLLKQYAIIHVHMRHNYKYIKMIHQLFFLKNKIILHDHYGNIDQDVSIPTGFHGFLRPNYYIGVSNSLTNWAINKIGLNKSRVFLLRNIVEKKAITNQKKTRKGLVLVGNIKPIKNQLFAIQLMEHIDCNLTLYGSIQDEAYYQLIVNEIERLGISDKIRFKHDCVEIQQELQQYELGLQTAISESGPLVVIEYLSQALPFVSYNTGEVIQLVKNELPSFIATNYNIDDWFKRIDKLRKERNEAQLERIYEKHFSEKVFLKQCEAIYESILK